MKLLNRLLDLIFPRRCLLCRRILDAADDRLCVECTAMAELCPPFPDKMHPSGKTKLHFLDSFTAVWYYKGNVRRSLLRYKFGGARHLASGYGYFLADKLLGEGRLELDVITWAPVSAQRRFRRGYDQAQLLAEAVGRELGLPVVRLLRKTRNNPAQSRLDFSQRKANVLGLYTPVNREAIAGKRILLLDDILTSGATAEECARTLLTAGAAQLHCGVIACAAKRS